jgi:serralysin
MKKTTLLAAAMALATPAAFPFAHLWDIQEVYTNPDGTVQFIEFFCAFEGEFFLSAAQLQLEVNGTAVNTLNFPDDLPGPTTVNRTFLAATANFEGLFGIAPDYIIPPNFLGSGSNRVLDFGPGFDLVSLTGLPANGVMSLNGLQGNDNQASTSLNAQATPRNYAGEEVTIPEPATASLLALGALGALARRNRARQLEPLNPTSPSA